MSNRRNFIKKTTAGVIGMSAALGISETLQAANKNNVAPINLAAQLKYGVASYTLKEFSTKQAIEMTLRCGINRMTFKSMHLPLDSGKDTIKKTVALCKEKGVELYGAGVVYMKNKEDVDQAF